MKPLMPMLAALSLAMPMQAHSEDKWEASTLSDSTISKIQELSVQYRVCLDQSARKQPISKMDIRDVASVVMETCEPKLDPIREAFLQEEVTPSIAERYLKLKRNNATRQVLKMLQFAKATQTAARMAERQNSNNQ